MVKRVEKLTSALRILLGPKVSSKVVIGAGILGAFVRSDAAAELSGLSPETLYVGAWGGVAVVSLALGSLVVDATLAARHRLVRGGRAWRRNRKRSEMIRHTVDVLNPVHAREVRRALRGGTTFITNTAAEPWATFVRLGAVSAVAAVPDSGPPGAARQSVCVFSRKARRVIETSHRIAEA